VQRVGDEQRGQDRRRDEQRRVVDRVDGRLPRLGVARDLRVVAEPHPLALRRDQAGLLEREDQAPQDREDPEDEDQDHRGKDEGPAGGVIRDQEPPKPIPPSSATSWRYLFARQLTL